LHPAAYTFSELRFFIAKPASFLLVMSWQICAVFLAMLQQGTICFLDVLTPPILMIETNNCREDRKTMLCSVRGGKTTCNMRTFLVQRVSPCFGIEQGGPGRLY
jgi:hypothetical protein